MTTQETIDRAERLIAGLQWPTPHSSAHIAQALADAGLLADPDAAAEMRRMTIEIDDVRKTNARLNRRAQLAEAALHKQLAHPHGAQDPTVEALAERVDEYRQRLWRARADIEYQKQLRRDVEVEHADCTTDLAIAEAQRDEARDHATNLKATMGERIAQAEKITRDVMAERDQARATIQRVRDLHVPDEDNFCWMDGDSFPCPTIRALDHEAQS